MHPNCALAALRNAMKPVLQDAARDGAVAAMTAAVTAISDLLTAVNGRSTAYAREAQRKMGIAISQATLAQPVQPKDQP